MKRSFLVGIQSKAFLDVTCYLIITISFLWLFVSLLMETSVLGLPFLFLKVTLTSIPITQSLLSLVFIFFNQKRIIFCFHFFSPYNTSFYLSFSHIFNSSHLLNIVLFVTLLSFCSGKRRVYLFGSQPFKLQDEDVYSRLLNPYVLTYLHCIW